LAFSLHTQDISQKKKQAIIMVTTSFTRPYEECNEELITMEEFINKMRSFNEMKPNARYPSDPHNYVYKIEVNNRFKRVHILKAYEIIEDKFDEIITLQVDRPADDENIDYMLVQMTKQLLDRCLHNHALKKIVHYAIMQSGKYEESDTEESDTEESDTEESDTEESDTEESDTEESDTDEE
jgi:hypothetical protein